MLHIGYLNRVVSIMLDFIPPSLTLILCLRMVFFPGMPVPDHHAVSDSVSFPSRPKLARVNDGNTKATCFLLNTCRLKNWMKTGNVIILTITKIVDFREKRTVHDPQKGTLLCSLSL